MSLRHRSISQIKWQVKFTRHQAGVSLDHKGLN